DVNRSMAQVLLGVGVRVVKGDQTGYGYTEELTRDALKSAALTAATIAEGPARKAPTRLNVNQLPNRYPTEIAWAGLGTKDKLPLLSRINSQSFAADGRIKKVTVAFNDTVDAILLVDQDGRMVEDLQPMTSMYLSCVAEQKGRRESGGYNVAGRAG